MAGGKETPRQKMIGMMYLVLTALLALNVSKQIIQAFVSMDQNTQASNKSQYQRGTASESELAGIAADASEPDRQKQAIYWMTVINKIDKAAGDRIKLIDDIKVEMLTHMGEDVKAIVTTPYDPKTPVKPAIVDIDKIAAKDQFDDPMHLMVGTDIINIQGDGLTLWNSLQAYRTEITEIVGNWTEGEGSDAKKYTFTAPKTGDFDNDKVTEEAKKLVDDAIKKGTVHPDDKNVIEDIFMMLTKDERVDMEETKGVHWMGRAFDHAPVVAAIAQLSSMETEVLNARAAAIAQIRGRVGGGQYSFNQIMPLAYGPEFVNQGDSVEIQVLMAAFDSFKMPKVTFAQDTVSDGVEIPKDQYSDGKGYIRFKAASTGVMNYGGTVAIQNKAGIWKERKWSKTIQIIKPSGTVSLPEMNVLYRGYNNIVQGAATGFPDFNLSGGGNVSLSKSGDHYVASPGNGKTANITISGKGTNGKSSSLGSFEFRVKPLPKADLYLGALGPDMDAPAGTVKAQSRLFAKYGEGIPLKADFNVVSWELNVTGAPKPCTGTGPSLSGEAMKYLAQVRKGNIVTITAFYTLSGGGARVKRLGSWQVK